MNTVQIYDVQGAVFEEKEMSLTELPPVPLFAEEELLKAGGTCNGFPNVRIVSGLGDDTEWVGGRYWKKYAFREHIVNSYTVWHKPDGSKSILTDKEGEVLSKAKNLKGVLLPVVDRKVIEHGIPRYFVEYYKPPESFGSKRLWEQARFDPQEDGTILDLMGEYPEEGAYETWFMIEEPDEIGERGEVLTTKFREVDEIVVEFIKQKIEEVKTKTQAEQHTESRIEVDKEYRDHKAKLKEDIKDIVKDRVHRLIT